MPESIRALIAILILGSAVLFYLKPVAARLGYLSTYRELSVHWYAITILSAVTGNYWLFLLVVFLYFKVTQTPIRANASWLVFVVIGLMMPPLSKTIPGFFGINHFGQLNWYRFLTLVLLLPFLFRISRQTGFRWFDHYPDKAVLAFIIIVTCLDMTRTPSITDMLRLGVFKVIDMVIPYYAISRGIRNIQDVKKLMFSCSIVISIAAFIAIFELAKSWHVYESISQALVPAASEHITAYKYRAGMLRASAAYGSIPLGYIVSLGFLMFYFFFPKSRDFKVMSIFMLLGLGILASLSRGPWMGFLGALIVLFYCQRKLSRLLVWGIIGSLFIAVSPVGDKFISLLPGVGSDSDGNISYRQDLFVSSVEVIKENPLFGSDSFSENPKMQHLLQGEQIIDIVNTYLQVSLEYGLVTLGLFIFFLLMPSIKLYRLSKMSLRTTDEQNLAHVLIAMMAATVVTIATVSSLGGGAISFIMWVLIATITAYIQILNKLPDSKEMP